MATWSYKVSVLYTRQVGAPHGAWTAQVSKDAG